MCRKPAEADQPTAKERDSSLDAQNTRGFLDEIFGEDLSVKRVTSLSNGVTGVLRAATLSIHAIGAAYAELAEIQPKSGVKQVDRYLSNPGFDVEALTPAWARFVVGGRREIVLALDWTDFADDDHTTLAAYLVTTHGRATPLAWKTVKKSALKGRQKQYEYEFIERLQAAIPREVEKGIQLDVAKAAIRQHGSSSGSGATSWSRMPTARCDAHGPGCRRTVVRRACGRFA